MRPKILDSLKGYSRESFLKDLTAGTIVGIVALPLAIAFAIASGVTPDKGLYTAIIAGFIISLLGGSRVQIGGPTGAFVVIVYGIVQQYGVGGLTIATFMAGIMIMLMGFARMGSVIKFIPHSLVVGFTSGIAVIIFTTQIKDFFGLSIASMPGEFHEKWIVIAENFYSINYYSLALSVFTIAFIILSVRLRWKIPGTFLTIIITTAIVYFFKIPVETIETKFGEIPSTLPSINLNIFNTEYNILELIKPAFTIALLGAVESLLSAVVADGMIGDNHRSNIELVAQGAANIFSALFGGIPATGAIARTATNVKNGGRTPIAGIVHAIVLLLIMLFFGSYAKLIPMACLAGILIFVAYNMSEYKSFMGVLRGPGGDVLILLTSFLLTVFLDLTIAIEIGMVLAAFLFMRRMAQISHIQAITNSLKDNNEYQLDPDLNENFKQIKGVEIYEINGPLFFGAAHQFKEIMFDSNDHPKVLILKMRNVPVIDETGMHNLKEFIKQLNNKNTKVILCGLMPLVQLELHKSRIEFMIGRKNIVKDTKEAIIRATELVGLK